MARRSALLLGLMPWDFDRLTPAEWSTYSAGARERQEDVWEIAAWMVVCLVNGVARKLKAPVNMTTLIPALHAKRTKRRASVQKAESGET